MKRFPRIALLTGVFLIFLFIILSLLFFKTAPLIVSASVNRHSMLIGEDLRYSLMFSAEKDVDIRFDNPRRYLRGFILKDKKIITKIGLTRKKIEYKYLFTQYNPGEYVIPSIMIRYKKRTGGAEGRLATRPIRIRIKSLLKSEGAVSPGVTMVSGLLEADRRRGEVRLQGETSRGRPMDTGFPYKIKDIANPKDILTSQDILTRGLIGIGIVIALIFLLILIQSIFESIKDSNAKPPYEIAIKKLNELKSKHLYEQGMVKEFCRELSFIMKDYIQLRFKLDSAEITTKEFLARIDEIKELTPQQKGYLRELIILCDSIKFAGSLPIADKLDADLAAERKFVEDTK